MKKHINLKKQLDRYKPHVFFFFRSFLVLTNTVCQEGSGSRFNAAQHVSKRSVPEQHVCQYDHRYSVLTSLRRPPPSLLAYTVSLDAAILISNFKTHVELIRLA